MNSSTISSSASPRQAPLAQPDVQRVLQQGFVVRADVQHHRQALARMQAGAGRVQRQLADRDAHAVRAEVAEPEDALAVGDDDHRRLAVRPVAHHVRDAATVGCGDEEPTGSPVDVPELLAGGADRRRVDDRHHLVRVLGDDPEEQRLVAVLQRLEKDVLREWILQVAEVFQHASDLDLLRADVRRQESAQAECLALCLRERRALVQRRVAQQCGAAREPVGQGRRQGPLGSFRRLHGVLPSCRFDWVPVCGRGRGQLRMFRVLPGTWNPRFSA